MDSRCNPANLAVPPERERFYGPELFPVERREPHSGAGWSRRPLPTCAVCQHDSPATRSICRHVLTVLLQLFVDFVLYTMQLFAQS